MRLQASTAGVSDSIPGQETGSYKPLLATKANKQTKKTTKELIKGNRGKEVWLGRAFGNAHRSVEAWLAGEIQRIP